VGMRTKYFTVSSSSVGRSVASAQRVNALHDSFVTNNHSQDCSIVDGYNNRQKFGKEWLWQRKVV